MLIDARATSALRTRSLFPAGMLSSIAIPTPIEAASEVRKCLGQAAMATKVQAGNIRSRRAKRILGVPRRNRGVAAGLQGRDQDPVSGKRHPRQRVQYVRS